MTNHQPTALSDAAVLAETARAVEGERQSTSHLLTLLAELDTRKLYLGEGYPSMFVYCTQALHLSEPAAYSRIRAARAARRFPIILTRLTDGSVTLTTVSLLAKHFTDENHEALLSAVVHRSKRDVERFVACLDPQPDVISSLRRLPVTNAVERAKPIVTEALVAIEPTPEPAAAAPPKSDVVAHLQLTVPRTLRRAVVAPLSPERFLLKVTLTTEAHSKLERIRGLLRHVVPTGDPAAIVERALTVLLDQLEKSKHGASRRLRPTKDATATSRHVPAAVTRAVWNRDDGRCAFVGTEGRCAETGFLEFHHVVPFALGGSTSVENLQLRCRAHNMYEAERDFPGRTPATSRRKVT